MYPLKPKGRQFDNFVVTGGTIGCNDNLRCTIDDKVVKLTIFCFQYHDNFFLDLESIR